MTSRILSPRHRADARRAAGHTAGTADTGFTLVELLIAMSIFAVAMALTASALVTLTRQTKDNLGRTESIDNARLGLEQIDRQVRSGNLFYDPAPSNGMRMLVFTQSNGDRKCAEWQVTASGNLQTRSWSPTWTTDGDVGKWGVIARGLVNNAPGVTPTSAFTVTSTGGSQPVLNVTLLVNSTGSRGKATEVRSTLSGRNTLFGYDPVACQTVPPA